MIVLLLQIYAFMLTKFIVVKKEKFQATERNSKVLNDSLQLKKNWQPLYNDLY